MLACPFFQEALMLLFEDTPSYLCFLHRVTTYGSLFSSDFTTTWDASHQPSAKAQGLMLLLRDVETKDTMPGWCPTAVQWEKSALLTHWLLPQTFKARHWLWAANKEEATYWGFTGQGRRPSSGQEECSRANEYCQRASGSHALPQESSAQSSDVGYSLKPHTYCPSTDWSSMSEQYGERLKWKPLRRNPYTKPTSNYTIIHNIVHSREERLGIQKASPHKFCNII